MNLVKEHPGHNFALGVLRKLYQEAPDFFNQKVPKELIRNSFDEIYSLRERSEYSLCNEIDIIFRKNLDIFSNFLNLSTLEKNILLFAIVYKTYPHFSEIINELFWKLDFKTIANIFSKIFPYDNQKAIEAILLNENILTKIGIIYFEIDNHSFEIASEFSLNAINKFYFEDFDIYQIFEEIFKPISEPHISINYIDNLPAYKLIKSYLKAIMDVPKKGSHILIYGPDGSEKKEIVCILCKELSIPIYEPNYIKHSSNELARFLSYEKLNYILSRKKSIIIYENAENFLRKEVEKGWSIDFLKETKVPTIWICNKTDKLDTDIVRSFDLVVNIEQTSKNHIKIMREYFNIKLGNKDRAQKLIDRFSDKKNFLSIGSIVKNSLEMIEGYFEGPFEELAIIIINNFLKFFESTTDKQY